MATVNYFFDCRREKSDGSYPVKICVCFSGQRILLPTGVDLKEGQWNGHAAVKCEKKAIYNQLLEYKKVEVEKAVLGLECRGITRVGSVAELKSLLERQMSGRFQASTYKVVDAFSEKMKALGGTTTVRMYSDTLKAIAGYCDTESLVMGDIDYRWICGFEAHLQRLGNKINSIAIDMRNLRAVFNHLIALGDIESDCYPFRKYKVRTEATQKRSIPVEQIRRIRDWPEGPTKRYADLFMLILYLCGINVADLCKLRDITPDGRIEYRRAKTGRLYSIKVEPEAMTIIEKYRGRTYLLDIFDRRKSCDYKSFTSRFNKYLKTMSPGLSTYSARHSFATICADLDIPLETIAAALGHAYGNPTTAIYIKPNQRKVDAANRRVIDFINSDLDGNQAFLPDPK